MISLFKRKKLPSFSGVVEGNLITTEELSKVKSHLAKLLQGKYDAMRGTEILGNVVLKYILYKNDSLKNYTSLSLSKLENEEKILSHIEKLNPSLSVKLIGKLSLSHGNKSLVALLIRKENNFTTLSSYIQKNGQNHILIRRVREAINSLHSLNIFHSNLHSGNILVRENNGDFEVKIIDFESSQIKENLGEKDKEWDFKAAFSSDEEICY